MALKTSRIFIRAVLLGAAIALPYSTANAAASGNPKIPPDVVVPYTQKGYPTFFSAWGADWMKRINGMLPQAATKAAESPECDKVDLVELSQQRSVPKKTVVFFVDCRNGKRFYIDQLQLQSTMAVQSNTSKMAAISDAQATEACETSIKSKLTNPLTYSRQRGTTTVYRAPTTGNAVVDFTFNAKNDLGALLPHKAHCVITDRGIEEATISKSL